LSVQDLLVEEIIDNDDYVRIVFRYSIIHDHAEIFNILTKEKPKVRHLQTLKLERVTLTIGGYDTGYGFQYTIGGTANPHAGKRIYLKGSEYPVKLEEDTMISELNFSFLEKEKERQVKKFRIRIVNDLLEIRPKPSSAVTKELVSLIKRALTSNSRVLLSSAKEKLRSAEIDFLRGRYRAAMHNIYYAMYNAIKSLQVEEGKKHFLSHRKVGKELEEILSNIQRRESRFQRLNLDEYLSVVEEARELRELADYGIEFEAGGNEKKIAQLLSTAEELVTISQYVLGKGIFMRFGKPVLHFPSAQGECPLPRDLLDILDFKGDIIMRSLIVLTKDFNATVFAYRLLSKNEIYFTDSSSYFFQGGHFARYKNGNYEYSSSAKKGFIELSRENVKKWSKMIKPNALEDLATCKENVTQSLCLFFDDCFLEIYVFPDGRIYLFSLLDEARLHLQLKAFRNIGIVIQKIVSKNWSDYSVLSSPIEIVQKEN